MLSKRHKKVREIWSRFWIFMIILIIFMQELLRMLLILCHFKPDGFCSHLSTLLQSFKMFEQS